MFMSTHYLISLREDSIVWRLIIASWDSLSNGQVTSSHKLHKLHKLPDRSPPAR